MKIGPPRVLPEDLERLGPQLRGEVDQVVRGDPLQVERGGLRRERLGGGEALAGDVRRRHRAFLDRPHRLAGDTVEDVGEGLLAHLHHGLDRPPVDGDVRQYRRRPEVVVPDAVVNHLEVPHAAAGLALEAEQALGEQVVARPVPAVPVVGRRGGRQVGVAQLLVGRPDGPRVARAGVLPRAVLPRLVAELARTRNGVERPPELAGDGVEAADEAGRLLPPVELIDGEDAHDERVAADERSGRPVVPLEVRDALRQVDHAACAELAQRIARLRVERHELLAADDEDPLVVALRVVPVAHAARRAAARPPGAVLERRVDPGGLPGGGIDGRRLSEVRAHEQAVADHQRRGLQRRVELQLGVAVGQLVIDRSPAPRDAQILHVVGADLVERRVLRAAHVPRVAAPLAARRALLRRHGSAGEEDHAEDARADRRQPICPHSVVSL